MLLQVVYVYEVVTVAVHGLLQLVETIVKDVFNCVVFTVIVVASVSAHSAVAMARVVRSRAMAIVFT